MNSRERTFRAIRRESPDRVPCFYGILHGTRVRHARRLDRLLERYPQDIAYFNYSSAEEYSGRPGVGATDRWGAVWVSASPDYKGQVDVHPLGDWSALRDYAWPEALGWPEQERAAAYLGQDRSQHYVLADGDTLFQRMMYLRGVEALLVDLATEREEAYELRDRIAEYMLTRIRQWNRIGVDGVYFRDDWGSQTNLLINPALWRRFYKPVYATLFDAVHAGGADVFFHSDGMIDAIIPDLVEIGVDVLHPQMALLGVDYLAENYGGRLSFMCDPDRQYLLPCGTPGQVTEYVRETVRALAPFGGGLIGWGCIGPDVPWENMEALVRAFAELGPSAHAV